MMAPQQPQIIQVVNTKPAYEGDPELKCHFETCQNVGVGVCRWKLGLCGRSKGCKKRYCNTHKHRRVEMVDATKYDRYGEDYSTKSV